MYYDNGAYDMNYGEFKDICHKACSERFNYFCIDTTKFKNEVKRGILNESKNILIECISETELFK